MLREGLYMVTLVINAQVGSGAEFHGLGASQAEGAPSILSP